MSVCLHAINRATGVIINRYLSASVGIAPDGVAPVNNLAVSTDTLTDSTVRVTWKAPTESDGPHTISAGSGPDRRSPNPRFPITRTVDSAFVFTVKWGQFYVAYAVSDSSGNVSAYLFDSLTVPKSPPVIALPHDLSIPERQLWSARHQQRTVIRIVSPSQLQKVRRR